MIVTIRADMTFPYFVNFQLISHLKEKINQPLSSKLLHGFAPIQNFMPSEPRTSTQSYIYKSYILNLLMSIQFHVIFFCIHVTWVSIDLDPVIVKNACESRTHKDLLHSESDEG